MTTRVFLHGFLGEPSDWAPVIDALPGASNICLPLPPAADWHEGLDQLVAQLPADCLLVGYSMGARLALGCALRAQDRIRGLVFIAGNPGIDVNALREERMVNDQRLVERLLAIPLEVFLAEWYRQPIFAGVDASEQARWIAARRTLDRQQQADLLRCYSVGRQPSYWPQLSELVIPTAVVVGALDARYVAIARRMVDCMSRAVLHIVDNVSHAVVRQCPLAVADAVIRLERQLAAIAAR
jgi:2-succinyl-6-hydroxy-2,4-cyclohexadiene-1-carboxylate synthase